MAFCRFYSSPFNPASLLTLSKSTSSFLNCPYNFSKFTNVPPLESHIPPSNFVFRTLCLSSSSMESAPEGYRKNIFAASRLDIPDAWQMPQGGIDEHEDPKTAAIRELKEETGISSAEVLAEAPNWLTYDFPPEVREKLKIQWGSDWKGQAQKWFLLKFTGKEDEINLLGDDTEKPEFGEWSWMSPEQIIDRAVDFKKPVYKEVLTAFAPHLE
ncbi:nudix hydrolase 26, chloroplastic isoform X2 [Euphorbia lathyris]|uniref:nudix hydrolase 26, chloroplastic isoform X2 n=1 Tax=Euphorbia lathyris TaxID=212925 RepID=UPI003313BD82